MLPEWKVPSAAQWALMVARMGLGCLLPAPVIEGDPTTTEWPDAATAWQYARRVDAVLQGFMDAQAERVRHGAKGGRSRVVWREENERRHRLVIEEAQKLWRAHPSGSVNYIARLSDARLSDDRPGLSTVRRIIGDYKPKR